MIDMDGKLKISFRLNRRILRTSVNLKKLDVRGLQRISPEGIQVHFVNTFQIRYKDERVYRQGRCEPGESS